MDSVQCVALGLFIGVLIAIVFEHKLNVQKAAISTVAALALWTLRALTTGEDVEHEVMEAGSEVVGIFLFLFAAMLLVEVLDHKGFFDIIRKWLYSRGYDDRKQFIVIVGISFFLSAVLDNLTTTLVMVTIAIRFFDEPKMLIAAPGIVTAANAGGAFSAIGDVTTIMLWVDGKFTASEVAFNTFLPSAAACFVTTLMLALGFKGNTTDSTEELEVKFSGKDKLIIALSLGCFSLPLIAHVVIGIPPPLFIGILGGLGLVCILVDRLNGDSEQHEETHLQSDIEALMRKLEYSPLVFFAGIILSVKALSAMGVLTEVTDVILGDNPSENRIVAAMVALGWLSAFVDNIPLTAIAMDAIPTENPQLWSLLAFTVGTGGSHLVVGSAAGIVAMSKVKALTSTAYIRVATIPVFVGYVVGVAVWWVQHQIV